MKNKIFAARNHAKSVDLALLVLRIVAGSAIAIHGWGKIQSPMNWMGPDAPVPGFLQFLAALSEFGGGIAIVLGLVTVLATFGLACTMLVAVSVHAIQMGDPFVNTTGGGSYEMASLYLMISFLLMAAGPGKFSIDRQVFGIK